MSVTVTLHIFSGRPDPTWELTDTQVSELTDRLARLSTTTLQKPPGMIGGLGYRGFSVQAVREPALDALTYVHSSIIDLDRFSANLVADGPDLETWLLDTAGSALPPEVRKFAEHQIATTPMGGDAGSDPNIRNALNVPPYNPGKWNNDPAIRTQNNCYNYANDLITNTFAQPGRGSGPMYGALSCAEVHAAASRDGLAPVPAAAGTPAEGHFAALVVAPGLDFHWYRLDSSGLWSHKPGQTAARDTDNSGAKISDPQTCDRGPYSDFCGFFHSVPAKVQIL